MNVLKQGTMFGHRVEIGHQQGEYWLGQIPIWLDPDDDRKATEQLNSSYQHGGGWDPFPGFEWVGDTDQIVYKPKSPDADPPMSPIAKLYFRDEVILVYPHEWIMVMQPDRSFEICRMN